MGEKGTLAIIQQGVGEHLGNLDSSLAWIRGHEVDHVEARLHGKVQMAIKPCATVNGRDSFSTT